MSLSLVVLAAGMWSRYGWLKQIDAFGPQGESLLEYAVYDALQAGFDHIVLVVRKEFEEAFREKFAAMLAHVPRVSFVYQTVDVWRQKPWWTLDAMLCAADVVDGPFAVVNADDRYGTQSYALLAQKLRHIRPDQAFLVGYVLWNTLSDHGTVNRWICHVHEGRLVDVVEHYAIWKKAWSIEDKDGTNLQGDEIVSMNFWWFHYDFFAQARNLLNIFKKDHPLDPKAEMPIPPAVDTLIHGGDVVCTVIDSPDSWHGVTNPEDKPRVQKAFDTLLNTGVYPKSLW